MFCNLLIYSILYNEVGQFTDRHIFLISSAMKYDDINVSVSKSITCLTRSLIHSLISNRFIHMKFAIKVLQL